MKLAELRQALRTADPAAVLVSQDVLERVIRSAYKMSTFTWHVPHRKCFCVDRHLLFHDVEQDELELEPNRLLPAVVILLARPSSERAADLERGPTLLKYWRRLFHAAVHRALNARVAEQALTPPVVRQYIAQIGPGPFEEVRTVLWQDEMLPPDADELCIFIEFASVYLELRHFAPHLLPVHFPSLPSRQIIDELLAQHVDGEALFQQTRLPGSPDPALHETQIDESYDFYDKLDRMARQAAQAGNDVRAAILYTRAARVAPAPLTERAQDEAKRHLHNLVNRLQPALELNETEVTEWVQVLPALLDKADQGTNPTEARLLFDLQLVCIDHEREIYTLDAAEWVLSGFRKPIKRPLPMQRLVRIVRHLREATRGLTTARLADAERQRLTDLLTHTLERSQRRLREQFRPVLLDALHDTGLVPRTAPEHATLIKIIEELLDLISEKGFFGFGDLRDAISRNQLKLPDLTDPNEYWRGDPLIRLDRRLATLLDGVYRRSDLYIRLLQKTTSLFFGTSMGRWLTYYLLIPVGSAATTLLFADLLLEQTIKQNIPRVTQGSWLLGLSLFYLALVKSRRLRDQTMHLLLLVRQAGWRVFIHWPRLLLLNPLVRKLFSSWLFRLFLNYLIKPLLLTILLYQLSLIQAPWMPDIPWTSNFWFGSLIIYSAIALLLNSQIGLAVQHLLGQTILGVWHIVRSGLITGLVRLTIQVFKNIINLLDYTLFSVEEWLRFRAGDGRSSLLLRTVLGVFWFPIAYVLRFYLVVLIEPMINPVKLPISILAAKVVYPLLISVGIFSLAPLGSPLVESLAPYISFILAWPLVVGTLYLLPDAVAFLIWETKENWSLYRANRAKWLEAEAIGPHAETVSGLLIPGFHSGTLPKLYARLRRVEGRAESSDDWRLVRSYRESLREVSESVVRLVNREFIALLNLPRQQVPGDNLAQALTPAEYGPFAIRNVRLGMSRIRIELTHQHYPDTVAVLIWEVRAGWLVADFAQPGWVGSLDALEQHYLALALSKLYIAAGIQFVVQQLNRRMPAGYTSFELVQAGVEFYRQTNDPEAIHYDLTGPHRLVCPRLGQRLQRLDGPCFAADELSFGRAQVSWEDWLAAWQNAPTLTYSDGLLPGGVESLLPIAATVAWPAPPAIPTALPTTATAELEAYTDTYDEVAVNDGAANDDDVALNDGAANTVAVNGHPKQPLTEPRSD
jgi:hypothetical protein